MSLRTPDNLDELVKAAQEGNKDAFGEIYDVYFEAIYRYVYFRVSKEDTDDIVETVFVKAWVNLPRYEKRDVSFGAWLFRIAHNAVIDHRRKHRNILPIDPKIQDRTAKAAPKEQAQKSLMAQTLRQEIKALKEPYRQVVTLKFLTGLSNAEIAEIMGEREGNVRVIQFRALKMLKEKMLAQGYEPEFLSQ